MLLQNKSIAIVGGGPGGLTLARLLQQKGVDVKVYESDFDKNMRSQGATLDLHESSGLEALKKANLINEFKGAYRPGAEKVRILDKMGNVLFDEHKNASAEMNFDSLGTRPEIDRNDLRNLLLNSLAPGTVVWDSQFVSMAQTGVQWEIKFKNGITVPADIVIGADGSNSKVRPFVTPIQPLYAGITILQGNVDNAKMKAPYIDKLLQGGKIYVHHAGRYLHISAKGDGSIDFYISSKVDEAWVKKNEAIFSDREQLTQWFRITFSEWDSVWFELFEHVDLPMLVRRQYSIPLDLTWDTKPNLTLIGDAAHIMPPSGEGANLAMLDALELSECLTNKNLEDIQASIAAYEASMLERATQEAATSFEMIEWMHAEDAQDKIVDFFKAANNKTIKLTNLHPDIVTFQNSIRAKYALANEIANKKQIVFVGSSLMEIFPVEQMQQNRDLGLGKIIYNRGVRATTTADLLNYMDTLIFDLMPSKIFINIGSNDIGFDVPEKTFLANYDKILRLIKEKLPGTAVYVMAYFPINTVDDFGEDKSEHDRLYEHRSNEKLNAANAKVEQLAKKNGYEFINVNSGLTDLSGNLRKELTFDGAHLLPAGYEIVFENMKKYLTDK